MKKLIMLLFLTACLGGGSGLLPEPRASTDKSKVVRYIIQYYSRGEWTNSAFYRMEYDEVDLPVRLAISNDGTACIIPDQDYSRLSRERDFRYQCRTRWISKR